MGGLVAEAMRKVEAAVHLPEDYQHRVVGAVRRPAARPRAALRHRAARDLHHLHPALRHVPVDRGTRCSIMAEPAVLHSSAAHWRSSSLEPHFNISAAVGYVAVFGVSVLNGVVLVSSIRQARGDGVGVLDAVVRGCTLRFRPDRRLRDRGRHRLSSRPRSPTASARRSSGRSRAWSSVA